METENAPFTVRLALRLRAFWRLAVPFWLFRDAHRGSAEQRIANYRFNRSLRSILPFYLAKWIAMSFCLMQIMRILSGLMMRTDAGGADHLCATLACMSAGIGFAFSCIVILMLSASYVYLSCVKR
jgi:hypothetical protein